STQPSRAAPARAVRREEVAWAKKPFERKPGARRHHSLSTPSSDAGPLMLSPGARRLGPAPGWSFGPPPGPPSDQEPQRFLAARGARHGRVRHERATPGGWHSA